MPPRSRGSGAHGPFGTRAGFKNRRRARARLAGSRSTFGSRDGAGSVLRQDGVRGLAERQDCNQKGGENQRRRLPEEQRVAIIERTPPPSDSRTSRQAVFELEGELDHIGEACG